MPLHHLFLILLAKSLRILVRAGEEWCGAGTLVVALGVRQRYLFLLYNVRFLRQQLLFAFQAPAIASQRTVLSNYAMTGYDQGHRIGSTGTSNGTSRLRLA